MSNYEEIERLVQGRNTAAARRLIQAFLRSSRGNEEAVLSACDWYRRLGLYREGFRLVVPEPPLPIRVSTRSGRGRQLLWAARFLNLLGSPELALPLLSHLEVESEEDHWIAGNIHLVNFEPELAHSHFIRMRELTTAVSTYQSRLRLLGLADSLSALRRFGEAEEMAGEVIRTSAEPLLLGIAHQAAGEYAARAGDFRRALVLLEHAGAFFPKGDRTADTAFLYKWLGYARARNGQRSSGLSLLDQAQSMLRKLRIRPEAWLDVYRLRFELDALDEGDLARLVHYPGLSSGFRRTLPTLARQQRFGPEAAPLSAELESNEYCDGSDRYSAIPREIQLAAWVGMTESWGLDVLKAKSLLWPGEAHAFFQLDGRLAQLLHRLRHVHGVGLIVTGGVIRLRERSRISVLAGGDPRPSFLREPKSFRARALSEHYRLSKTQRAERLGLWEDHGWIRRVGTGPATRYRTTMSGSD
ncbi:MAG: hypothetical protein ACXVC0_06095 [Bdellovibrionota bacterium]